MTDPRFDGADDDGYLDPDDQVGEPAEPDPPTPRHATALSYEPGATAPTIVATGSGYVAEQIIRTALESGVPVRTDPALANALSALDLGAEVPQELYRAVAETLAWAYRLDHKLAQTRP